MGRKRETSLGSFSVPCDIMESEGMRGIIDVNGAQAVAVYIAVMCAIHQNSYFVELSDDVIDKIATQSFASRAYVRSVITRMVESGMFSLSHYESYNVLTSRDIVVRYVKTMKAMRRKISDDMPYINDFVEVQSTGSNTDALCSLSAQKEHDVPTVPTEINPDTHPPEQELTTTDSTRELLEGIGEVNEITTSIMMRCSLDINSVKTLLDEFCSECKFLKTTHTSRKDALYHFINWIRIRQTARGKPNERNTASRRRGVEAGLPSAEEYFQPFIPTDKH